jgi:mono/diheme cytochrome c family protein
MKPLLAMIAALLAAPAWAQDADRGAALYQAHCAACHGASGQGDGPMAAVLTLPMPDLTALTAGGDFPLLDVIYQIDGRAGTIAHGGPMPVFGSWFEGDGPDVALAGPGGQPVLVSRPIADLVAFLQEVQS